MKTIILETKIIQVILTSYIVKKSIWNYINNMCKNYTIYIMEIYEIVHFYKN